MLELQFRYSPLFSFKLYHNFYTDHQFKNAKFVLTNDGEAFVKKCGILLKADEKGIAAYLDGEKKDRLLYLLRNFDENIELNFKVFSKNQYLINFTDLPTETNGKILYFSNLELNNQPEEEIDMHESPFVSSENLQTLSSSLVELEPKGEDATWQLFDEYGSELYNEKVKGKLRLDLTEYTPGRYWIKENNKDRYSFVYTGCSENFKPIGLVKISISKLKQQIIDSIEQEDKIPSFTYRVMLRERFTYWKYFIVPKYSGTLKDSVIETGESDVKFSTPKEVTMANGETAFLYESDKHLPLKEISDFKFLLKNKAVNGGGGRVLMNRLPTPSFEVIKPESRDANSKIFSEVIVYI